MSLLTNSDQLDRQSNLVSICFIGLRPLNTFEIFPYIITGNLGYVSSFNHICQTSLTVIQLNSTSIYRRGCQTHRCPHLFIHYRITNTRAQQLLRWAAVWPQYTNVAARQTDRTTVRYR